MATCFGNLSFFYYKIYFIKKVCVINLTRNWAAARKAQRHHQLGVLNQLCLMPLASYSKLHCNGCKRTNNLWSDSLSITKLHGDLCSVKQFLTLRINYYQKQKVGLEFLFLLWAAAAELSLASWKACCAGKRQIAAPFYCQLLGGNATEREEQCSWPLPSMEVIAHTDHQLLNQIDGWGRCACIQNIVIRPPNLLSACEIQ